MMLHSMADKRTAVSIMHHDHLAPSSSYYPSATLRNAIWIDKTRETCIHTPVLQLIFCVDVSKAICSPFFWQCKEKGFYTVWVRAVWLLLEFLPSPPQKKPIFALPNYITEVMWKKDIKAWRCSSTVMKKSVHRKDLSCFWWLGKVSGDWKKGNVTPI